MSPQDNRTDKEKNRDERIGNNIKSLLIAANNMPQSKLAEITNTKESTISKYCNGQGLPTSKFFMALRESDHFIDYDLNVDDLMYKSIDFISKKNNTNTLGVRAPLSDLSGNYFMYYFDTSLRDELKLNRGMLTIYKEISYVDSDRYKVLALFDINSDVAETMKNNLDVILSIGIDSKSSTPVSENKRRIEKISQEYLSSGYEFYTGHVLFGNNTFDIVISSQYYSDNPSISFIFPPKKKKELYFGGLGASKSISRGRHHEPAMQKIGISRYNLEKKHSTEVIGDILKLYSKKLDFTQEGKEGRNVCKKYYGDSSTGSKGILYIDEDDKDTIVDSRLARICQKKFDKECSKIIYVTHKDDESWYRLIMQAKA